ncbi:hypothetical protein EW145_g6677, partial [Phellinidium pouzarii]
VTAALDAIARELGPLDVVILNAGVNLLRPFTFTPFDDWWRVFEVNLQAPLMLAHIALQGMRERKRGALVFISSRAGALSLAGWSAYNVSKTALNRAVACLQRDLDLEFNNASGIHMYSIHPGGVKSSMTLGALHPDVEIMQPGFSTGMKNMYDNFVDTPELSAWTCVYLATGRAAALRGRYIDVGDDIEDLVCQSDVIRKENLYDLTVGTLGGEV